MQRAKKLSQEELEQSLTDRWQQELEASSKRLRREVAEKVG